MFFKKKKDEKKSCCGGNSCCDKTKKTGTNFEKKDGVLVLGAGCAKCNELEANVKEAMVEMGLSEDIYHITDYAEMASYGVMSTPALVVDKTVVSAGRVLSKNEALEILKKARS